MSLVLMAAIVGKLRTGERSAKEAGATSERVRSVDRPSCIGRGLGCSRVSLPFRGIASCDSKEVVNPLIKPVWIVIVSAAAGACFVGFLRIVLD